MKNPFMSNLYVSYMWYNILSTIYLNQGVFYDQFSDFLFISRWTINMDRLITSSFLYILLVFSSRVLCADPTVWGKYPGVVAIAVSSLNKACVGHIINNQHVVTAAQCVLDEDTFQVLNVFWFKVTAGDIKLFEPTQYRAERNISNIFPHELYNPQTNENDIAILRLDAPFSLPHNTIEPVILNSRIVKTSTTCDFVGWKIDQQRQSEQQSTPMLVYDRDFCNSQQYPGRIFESVMCGQLQMADDLPVVNYGGGLYCNSELTGLLTIPQNGTSTPSVFTQIRFYRKWIQNQIYRVDVPTRRRSPVTKI
ncbi:trypsin eta-like isoform X2 [Hermetia illucens]|uniref:trypsin eta-like isoform X2 n=1 Tax=Hermetia illucens TaxID=343691 RepID=UPI0018CC2BC8|nr:trypsin eta-like isoform X2 [Hermetia illucens]